MTKKTKISQQLQEMIAKAVNAQFEGLNLHFEAISLEHPTLEEHGDYSSNVSLQLAKQLGKNPREMATLIVADLQQSISADKSKLVEKVEVAGAGFINFWLRQEYFVQEALKIQELQDKYGEGESLSGKKIMVEFAHPNTHKEMHIGHMRTLITGESLARIFNFSGAEVFRANYQGDIGPHVAKAIWGTVRILDETGKTWDEAEKLSLKEKSHLLGQGYIRGNHEYEENKNQIDQLNKQLYLNDPLVTPIYERTKKWSLDYYEAFYRRFYTKFDRLFLESEVAQEGKRIVEENVGKVFEKSDGAIIFAGENFGLHTRVFVTKDGNPTYEGKEMALGPMEFKEFPFDKCIHVVASEQAGYFQVVIKALEQLDPKFIGREFHLSMGMVQLVGKKISSRTGVIITVDGLIDDVKELLRPKLHSDGFSEDEKEAVLEAATIGAVKYSVLKSGPLLNATFDLEKSVALDGDSGPYIQYTFARAKSILRKSKIESTKLKVDSKSEIVAEEMALLRWLYRFPEVVEQTAQTYSPNIIATYLFELAKRFNNFYNSVPILGSENEVFKLALVESTSIVLKNGLNLLGIESLERM